VKKIVVLEEAAEDIERARDFYDLLEAGVGDYCADSLFTDIERLSLFHVIHAKHFGFHRMLADRFPFGIYYRENKTVTEVFAVLDLRRDPAWLRAELSKRNG
jgi:hypothetical protein